MRATHLNLRRPVHSPPVSSIDPAAVANRVRLIAHDLQQMLKKTTSSPAELHELERRIDELRVHTHGSPLISIDRWLESSRKAIRERALAESISIKDKHTGAPHCTEYRTSC